MKKPILFVVYISIACCVGFIVGVYFSDFYSRDIVSKTASEFNEVQKLFDWYQFIIFDDNVLKDLNSIKELEDLGALKDKYKKNGLSNVRLFKKQADSLKRNAANSAPIVEFEKSIDEFEKHFNQKEP